MRTDDDDVRDLFARANPDGGPGLGISAEDIATRGRRVHRRRRQLATVGGTVAVIAAAVLATTLARPQVSPAGPGSTQVPITHTAPTPKLSPTKTPPPPTTTVTTLPTTTSAPVPTP
ncbi:MAG TPA: hypothetical protein VGN81_01775 [Pseudonocardiaceae bacterium]